MAAKTVNRYELDWIKYKQCTKCLKYKEANSNLFDKKKTWFLWLRSICKECCHKQYIKNKDIRLEQSKIRYNNKKEKILLQVKEYYIKHRDHKIEYAKEYRKNNNDIIKEKDNKRYREKRHWLSTKEEIENYKKEKLENRLKNRPNENWSTFHRRTMDYIKENNLRPKNCSICLKKCKPLAHHPNYSKWNEVVFVCDKCHQNIHAWNIKCPDPIDILAAAWRRRASR